MALRRAQVAWEWASRWAAEGANRLGRWHSGWRWSALRQLDRLALRGSALNNVLPAMASVSFIIAARASIVSPSCQAGKRSFGVAGHDLSVGGHAAVLKARAR